MKSHLIVKETFRLHKHGLVVVVDTEINVKVGDCIKRVSDGESWTIKGIERWSHRNLTDAILLNIDATIVIGDELILI